MPILIITTCNRVYPYKIKIITIQVTCIEMDKYNKIARISSGRYGSVFLAGREGKKYAVKKQDIKTVIAIIRELSMYNILNHPNIMKPYEYIVSDDNKYVYIVMQYLSSTLDSVIKKKPKESLAKLYMWQLLSAVDYMHKNNIMHRDLKPTNILVNDTSVVIIDFGLAKYMYGNDRLDYNIQTPEYKAPEVYRKEKYSYSVDIWSLGIILIEMMMGDDLYSGTNKEIEDAILKDQKGLLRKISNLKCTKQCRDVILSMVQYDPTKRSSAEDLMKMPWFSQYIYTPPNKIIIHRSKFNKKDLERVVKQYEDKYKEAFQDLDITVSGIKLGIDLIYKITKATKKSGLPLDTLLCIFWIASELIDEEIVREDICEAGTFVWLLRAMNYTII